MARIDALVYLPIKPERAKILNLPLKLPVLAEDLGKIADSDEIDLEVIIRGLRKQCEVSGDEYYESYLVYHYYELFKQKLAEGDLERCQRLLEEAKDIREDYRYIFYRSQLMLTQSDTEKAEIDLRFSLSMKPDFYVGHYELGKLLMSKGEHEDAISSFERSIESSGGTFMLPLIGMLDAYISMGHLEAALDTINRLPDDFPLITDAQLRKGVILNELQNYDAAEKAFSAALSTEQRWPLLFNRAFSRTRLGRLQEAMEDLERAHQLSSSPDVIYELGLLQKNLGLVEDALENLQKYYHTTKDPKALIPLSMSSMLLGEYEKALSFAELSDGRSFLKEMIYLYGYLDSFLPRPLSLNDPLLDLLRERYSNGSLEALRGRIMDAHEKDASLHGIIQSDGHIDYETLVVSLKESGISEASRKRLKEFTAGRFSDCCSVDMDSLCIHLRLTLELGANLREIDLFAARFPFLVSGEGRASAVCKTIAEVYKWALAGGQTSAIEIAEYLVTTLKDLDHHYALMVSRVADRELELDSLIESSHSDPASYALAVLEASCSGGLSELPASFDAGREFTEALVHLTDMEVPNDERRDI